MTNHNPARTRSQVESAALGAGAEPQGGPEARGSGTQLPLGHRSADPTLRPLVATPSHRRRPGARRTPPPAPASPPAGRVNPAPDAAVKRSEDDTAACLEDARKRLERAPSCLACGEEMAPLALAPWLACPGCHEDARKRLAAGSGHPAGSEGILGHPRASARAQTGVTDDTTAGAAEPQTSSVHTRGVTRQSPADIEETRYPVRYLAALAESTAGHQQAKAQRCMDRARRVAIKGDAKQRARAVASRRYWRNRAHGELRRWEKVATCGDAWGIRGVCKCGGDTDMGALGCGVVRACPVCRVRFQRQRRERAHKAVEAVEKRYAHVLGRERAPWAWRFLTLTIPHGRGMGADARQVGRMFGAFWRMLKAYIRIDLGEAEVPKFLRHIEGTAGRHEDGHVHVHALVVSPFLPYPVIRMLWGRVLESYGRKVPRRDAGAVIAEASSGVGWREAQLRSSLVTMRGRNGRPLASVQWPVCDVRRVVGDDAVAELVKYIVKDRDKDGLLNPRVAGDLYVAMDGVRALAASRGLWAEAESDSPGAHCACGRCGEVGHMTFRVVRKPQTTGPPALPANPVATLLDPVTVESGRMVRAWRGYAWKPEVRRVVPDIMAQPTRI